jgi:catechol 2,3-dioxygenase-like lactoylglutathione lyase family enzyme
MRGTRSVGEVRVEAGVVAVGRVVFEDEEGAAGAQAAATNVIRRAAIKKPRFIPVYCSIFCVDVACTGSYQNVIFLLALGDKFYDFYILCRLRLVNVANTAHLYMVPGREKVLASSQIMVDLPVVDLNRARKFYEEKLGFKPVMLSVAGPQYPDVVYEAKGGAQIYLYQRGATKADHTVLSFMVGNIEQEVKELKDKGVVFEEYDMPGIKMVDSVATYGNVRSAWFKDTEGNILEIGQVVKRG